MARFGYVSRSREHVVADVFNLSRAEVRGIVSFYHDLKTAPQPPLQVRVCQAEACQSVGARELTARVGITPWRQARRDERDAVSLDAVYCLGLCAQAPSMMVNGRPLARADLCDLGKEMVRRDHRVRPARHRRGGRRWRCRGCRRLASRAGGGTQRFQGIVLGRTDVGDRGRRCASRVR